MIYHVEVHSKDRQIEHYICPNCENEGVAIQRIQEFYGDRGQKIGLWENEDHKVDSRIQYLIFRIKELEARPVIYIAGEYRPAYPI